MPPGSQCPVASYVSRLLQGITLPILTGALIAGFVLCTTLVLFWVTQSELRAGEARRATGTAVSAIQSVSGKVAEIQSFTGAIAAAVEEQTAAAEEIASNVALAANASKNASVSSSEVSKTAAQTRQLAVSVSNVSQHLTTVSSQLSKAVSDFLAAVAEDISDSRHQDAGEGIGYVSFAQAA